MLRYHSEYTDMEVFISLLIIHVLKPTNASRVQPGFGTVKFYLADPGFLDKDPPSI